MEKESVSETVWGLVLVMVKALESELAKAWDSDLETVSSESDSELESALVWGSEKEPERASVSESALELEWVQGWDWTQASVWEPVCSLSATACTRLSFPP